MSTVARLRNLQVILGKKFIALNDIDLTLEGGKIIGLIGPSGAGKTTLMRALVGMVQPSRGSLRVFDAAPGSPEARHKIAFMTQELSVYQDLSVQQNLEYFGTLYGAYSSADLQQRISDVLSDLELSDKSTILVRNLSGGQKQRVSLAASLVGDHTLLILDEPTTGLDPVLRQKLWAVFKKLRDSGVSIILSSHAMDEAQKCDDIVLIRAGSVIAHESPVSIMKRTKTTTVEDAFLQLVGEGTV